MKKNTFLILVLIFTKFCVSAQEGAKLFNESYNLLNRMLVGETKYSFKNAVFSVENAYLDGKLDTIVVNKQIQILHNLSLSVFKERIIDYSEKDKETVNKWASVFEVMCDTIPINIEGQTYKYIPFSYDFDDAFGHTDWSNVFVSKLLNTRKGNCHSLPYLYKILAEELGVEANLALAPNHIYIKHRSLRDGWYNTELTSGIFPIDAWLMASGYVHVDAITNGVYMKALNDKESIALLMIDLAQSYQNKFPVNDGSFILKSCETAINIYPNFATALILRAETHKTQIQKEQDLGKRKLLYQDLAKEYAHINDIGYRNMPEDMYINWLVSLKQEKEKYENKNLNTFNKK